jgi:hypothetical protein
MIAVAIMLFAFAAVFGLIVLIAILKNHPTPKPVVVIHGSLGGIGLLVLLTYLAMGNITPLYIASLSLLLIAITIGFTVFGFDISNKRIPKSLAILHPILAIAGIVLLILYASHQP